MISPRRIVTLLLLLLLPLSWGHAHTRTGGVTIDVLFISPAYAGDPFWLSVEQQMGYAAKSLGFNLQIRHGNDSPLRVRELASAAMSGVNRPDFIMLQFNGPSMPEMLQLADLHRVRIVTFNTPPYSGSRLQIGKPGHPYRNWIAHLWPDDRQAGYLEAQLLLQAARKRWPERETLQLLAFNGARYDVSRVAQERGNGLHDAISRWHGSQLAQEFSHYWNVEKATQPLAHALQRYPEVTLLWSANDSMALRLYSRLTQSGRSPRDFLLAGIDATPAGLRAVEEGKLVGTVGGHFLEGAWGLVVIHDYLYHRELLPASLEIKTGMYAFDSASVLVLRQLREQHQLARLDYHRFSLANNTLANRDSNPERRYDFSWPTLLSVLHQQEMTTP